MKKWLKIISMIVGIALLLFIITVISIVTFVSPNRLKPFLTDQVMKYTGRELTIDGDLAWTFFPSLGIKTNHMMLSNPPGFQQPLLAEIQTANISVHLFPLLHNKIESNGIVLHGLKLYLIKNAKGQENWSFPVATTTKNSATSTSTNRLPLSAMSLAIAGINVSDGQVTWVDEQTQKSITIDQFELHAKDINFLQPFPLTMEFNFSNQHPAMRGHVKLHSQLAFNMPKQIFAFRSLEFIADIEQANKKYNVTVTGDVNADLQQQTLQWSDFHAVVGDLVLTGKVGVTGLLSNPSATGHLTIDPFDLRDWLKSVGQDVTNIQAFKTVAGDVDIASEKNVMHIQGKLSAEEVQINHIKLTHVLIPIHLQQDVLTMVPITANFYQGTLSTNATLKMQTEVPHMVMDGKLSGIQVGPLLDDLGDAKKKLKFSGTGNIDFQMTTAGIDSAVIVKNLDGVIHLNLTNGTLEGIDIRYYLDMAKAFLGQRAPSATNTNKTEFANMTASANIKNGVVQNNDLVITSELFTSKGNGTIDLVNQKINYQLDTLINQSGAMQNTGWADLAKIPIPVLVSGNLSDPTIKLDSGALSKAISSVLIDKTKQNLQQKIEKKMGNQGAAILQNLLGH